MILRTLWKVCEHIEVLYDWERLMMQSGVTLNFVKRLGVYLLYIGCDPMTCHGSIIAPWTYPLSSARGSQARLRQTSTLVGDDSGSLGVELFCFVLFACPHCCMYADVRNHHHHTSFSVLRFSRCHLSYTFNLLYYIGWCYDLVLTKPLY